MMGQRGDEPRWFCLYQQQRDPIHQVHALHRIRSL